MLCTADNPRQIEAIYLDIDKAIGKAAPEARREGEKDSGWMLLDYGDVIVHIFGLQEREYYGLDQLWGKARTVVSIQ